MPTRVLRLRGLSYSVNEEQIREFFEKDFQIVTVYLCSRFGELNISSQFSSYCS